MAAGSYYIGGHGGDEHAEAAYTIATADDDHVEEAVEVVPFSEVLASADAGSGARVVNKWKGCHSVDAGVNKVGPSMFGVVDRSQASEDFGYSDVLVALGGSWTTDALNEYLTKPSEYAPGNAMSFAGLPKEKDRANVIAYLATLQ